MKFRILKCICSYNAKYLQYDNNNIPTDAAALMRYLSTIIRDKKIVMKVCYIWQQFYSLFLIDVVLLVRFGTNTDSSDNQLFFNWKFNYVSVFYVGF